MPRIPTYDSAIVEERALPGAMQSSIVSPDLLGAGAAKTIATGQQIEGAGDKLNAIAVHAIQQQDLRDVNTASATFGKAQQDYHMDALKNRTGKQADRLTTDYDKWQEDTIKEISKTLLTPRQVEAFQTQAGRSGLSMRSSLGSFQVAQQAQAATTAFEANAAGYIRNGITAAGTPEAMVFLDQLVKLTAAHVLDKNMGKPEADDLMVKVRTEFHKQRIEGLASNDNTALEANAYFTLFKKEIDPRQWDTIGKKSLLAATASLGSAAAGEAWTKFGPKTMGGPINTLVMTDYIREKLKGNEEAIAVGLAGVHSRASDMRNQTTSNISKVASDVSNLITTKKLSEAALRSDPTFQALQAIDGGAANGMLDYVKRNALHAISMANAVTDRDFQKVIRDEHALTRSTNATYFEYSNPDWVSSKSRDDIRAKLPEIGPVHVGNLLRLKDSFDKSAANLVTARFDATTFKALAIKSGLHPTKRQLTEEDKNRIVQVEDAVRQALSAAQDGSRTALKETERREITTRVFDDKIMVPSFYSIGASGAREMPASAAIPGELEKAFVRVKGTDASGKESTEDIDISKLPREFRDDTVAQFAKEGRQVTQQGLADAWVDNRKTWRPKKAKP